MKQWFGDTGQYSNEEFIQRIENMKGIRNVDLAALKKAGLANDLMVNPLRGWRYGYPRHFTIAKDESVEDWFRGHGYPDELIRQGALRFTRFWPIDEQLRKA